MSVENSTNTPIEWPEVLQEELESFGFPVTPVDMTKPVGQRLGEIHQRIRALQPDRSALCFSGGGIRSATFALGVVQRWQKPACCRSSTISPLFLAADISGACSVRGFTAIPEG
jgi:hypothetical protein